MATIDFLPGDGTHQSIEVSRISGGFARNEDGVCAFCEGDPCAEFSRPDSRIAEYFERARTRYGPDATWYTAPATCPLCEGRAT